MRNMFAGERLPSTVLAPLERGGGRGKEGEGAAERDDQFLKNSKFMEPGRYRVAGEREGVELKRAPKDLDQKIESFEELESFVFANMTLFSEWMFVNLDKKLCSLLGTGIYSPKILEDAKSATILRYLIFLAGARENDEDFEDLKEWFQKHDACTYRDFHGKTLQFINYKFQEFAGVILFMETHQGVPGKKDSSDKYRRLKKEYEQAQRKLEDGRRLLPFEEDNIEAFKVERDRSRRGGAKFEPLTFASHMKTGTDETGGATEYESHHPEVTRDRNYMLGKEEAEDNELQKIIDEFDLFTPWIVKMKLLENSISNFENIRDAKQQNRELAWTSKDEVQLRNYKAEQKYQIKKRSDKSVRRKGVASEFASQGEEAAELADKMESVWGTVVEKYQNRKRKVIEGKLNYEKFLFEIGLSLECLLDEISPNTYLKKKCLKAFREYVK
jgi:hypothetical protein